ncbi:class I SAM-dependent methyltransferase [Paenibacillus campi]|uniref:class I SAM-dependent methyltransferase n=1 Tax=Paenibacillus campi TaxID=3106031 RepID=UPI002AFE4AD7|nr:class I SAM-dependent methyltransferase [Paenibacillus sp. SGZ-1009]
MPINFHDEQNKHTYATRSADHSWIRVIAANANITHKQIADIGCGGGIYTKALSEMGAAHITGVDFSDNMLQAAAHNCAHLSNVAFQKGTAYQANLPAQKLDIVLERALIHHLDDLDACFREAARLLKRNGMLIIQDRTPQDCLLPGDCHHIRGYFFEQFPRLIDREINSRYDSTSVQQALEANGLRVTQTISLWETRKVYGNLDELQQDLLLRTGRSILHELTDEQLQELVFYIVGKLANHQAPIIEQDRWTLWFAVKE